MENPKQTNIENEDEVTEVRVGDKDRHVASVFFSKPVESEGKWEKVAEGSLPSILMNYSDGTPVKEDEDSAGDYTAEENAKGSPKKVIAIVAAFIVIAVAVFGVAVSRKMKDMTQPELPLPSETMQADVTVPPEASLPASSEAPETEVPASDAVQETTEPERTVVMLVSKTNIIPGQILSEADFELEPISESEFRKLTVTEDLYTENELDALIGLQTKKFIPAGKFINYNTIGSYSPVNPWDTTATENIITLPVSFTPEELASLTWGSLVDLTITVQTKQTNANEQNNNADAETPDQEGIEHESSVVESMIIDTYKLQGVAILDMLDFESKSLYARYFAISEIPEPFAQESLQTAYGEPQTLSTVLPSFVKIRVTTEQASLISSIEGTEHSITFGNAATAAQTEYEAQAYGAVLNAQKNVAVLWEGYDHAGE